MIILSSLILPIVYRSVLGLQNELAGLAQLMQTRLQCNYPEEQYQIGDSMSISSYFVKLSGYKAFYNIHINSICNPIVFLVKLTSGIYNPNDRSFKLL